MKLYQLHEGASWQMLGAERMFNYAVDHLSDEDLEKLNDELQGLHIEDRADHEEAKQIMVKFLTAHLKD